jgi:hypothetical protein
LLQCADAFAQDVARGQMIFSQNCQVCHGMPPMGGPDRAGNNPALIRNAINGRVPAMSGLRFLTDADLADIAAWIASLSAPPPPSGPPVPAFDYTDLWYAGESESGWGLNIIQHASNNIFAVMYTYDAANRPVWFVLPGGTWTAPNIFTGAWYRVTGPSYLQQPFNSAQVDPRAVGTATLNFSDAAHGTLTFVVNGTQVSKSIIRQPF